MFRKIFFGIVLQGSTILFAQQGVLKINVADKTNEERLEMANVLLESAGVVASKGVTDEEGNLVFKNLAPGTYNVKSSYVGYQKTMIKGVLINNNETTYLDVRLMADNTLPEFIIEDYRVEIYEEPLIDPYTSIKTIFTREELDNSVYSDPLQLISSVAGAVETKEGMMPHFRGAREGSVVYIIDGERVVGTPGLPQGAIEQMSVMLGGIPAQYGDATGAFIEIETRSGLVSHKK